MHNIYIYIYEVIGHVQTPKHSNCMLLLMICFEFLRTNFLKKHVPESTPGGRQPHWNQRWPCVMWRYDSELVQSATPPKTNILNPNMEVWFKWFSFVKQVIFRLDVRFQGCIFVSCLADYNGTYHESVCISLPLPGNKWGRKLSEFSINYVLVLQNQRVMMHHHSYWESVLTGFNLKLGSGRKKHGICIVACCFSEPVYRHEYRFFINNISINIESYCWWKKSCTTWNV